MIQGFGRGGGVAHGILLGRDASVVALFNSTVSDNYADTYGGGIIAFSAQSTLPVTTTIQNSIIAGNTATTGANCYANSGTATISFGHNLEDADSCGFDQLGDLVQADLSLVHCRIMAALAGRTLCLPAARPLTRVIRQRPAAGVTLAR